MEHSSHLKTATLTKKLLSLNKKKYHAGGETGVSSAPNIFSRPQHTKEQRYDTIR